MACYRPNIRLASLEPDEKTGKSVTLKFYGSSKDKKLNYEWFDKENEKFKKYGIPKEYQRVPCGWCSGCQKDYASQWAIRCMNEAKDHENNWFITLTYDDEHLPRETEMLNEETGEIEETDIETGTLVKKDFSKFLKDLRRYYEYHHNWNNIRFYGCGEYGGQTERPHYHMILFNMPIALSELTIYKVQKDGTVLYNADVLTKIWGKGYVVAAEVNYDTCSYVARYVMKKQKGKVPWNYYKINGQEPEFILMSRMPGIGRNYAARNLNKIYENDEIVMLGHDNKAISRKPPKYYDSIYDIAEPDKMAAIKEQRKETALNANKIKSAQTSLNERERLIVEEDIAKEKWASLKRDKL